MVKVELDEAIKGRRSIREYQDKDISESVIEELLDLARYAPSSMDGQPWHFIIVRETETKRQLTEIKNKYCPLEKQNYRADFLQNANTLVVVCVDKEKSYGREIEDGVLATANIMLGAYSRGIGSVYMSACRTDEPRLAEGIGHVLALPENLVPITLVPLGYPDEIPKPKKLRSLDEMIHYMGD